MKSPLKMAAKRSMVLTAGSHLMINEERAEKGEFKYHVRRCSKTSEIPSDAQKIDSRVTSSSSSKTIFGSD